jgi:hypothetical protein
VRLTCRMLLACALLIWLAPSIRSQEPPKPGPEHEHLKQMEGTWDATIKFGDQESKGTMTYKFGMGGYWLVSHFEGDFGGMKFEGRGMDTYDSFKKKYVSAWADSMAPFLLVMEGDYDKENKTLTMTGDGPSPTGKVKYKAVTKMPDADSMEFNLSAPGPDGKEAVMLTINYKRRQGK